ncbi:MAG TPA: hypothetical protein VFR41_03230 [Acidimicrobiia bacterium]|nr:hypothetical protein [Acidimicrobiia bacterium]
MSTATVEPEPAKAPRRSIVVAGVLVLLFAVVAAYALGESNSSTKKVVEVVAPVTTTTTGRNCIPGAAAGSCNTDEFAEQQIAYKPLNAATQAELGAQLVAARAAAMRYPTVADAERAGMLLAGKFSPLTGAHFINIAGAVGGAFDPSQPGSYIYDGISPSSRVIGLMYLSSGLNASAKPPAGFAGPNDLWHRHSNTCVVYANGKINVPFPADSNVTQAMCDAKHGVFMVRTTWMVHAWVVPGWESPSGVFSHDNAHVLCADGTTKTDASGFCLGT